MRNPRVFAKGSSLAVVAAFSISLMGATPAASAINPSSSGPPGVTESDFIRQATSQGVAPEVAAKAWGNRDAMARIPVSSTLTIKTSSGFTATTTSNVIGSPVSTGAPDPIATGNAFLLPGFTAQSLTTAQAWSHWTTCTQTTTNIFGWMLNRLQMDKQWTSVGTTVSSPAVQTYGSGAWGWSFNGIINSNDFYSTANGNSHGAHTSYRMGAFAAGQGDLRNAWVQVTGTSNTSTCTKGG